MLIRHASESSAGPAAPDIAEMIGLISDSYLREVVETISVPRHFVAEAVENRRVGKWIESELLSFGYETCFQGEYGNILAMPAEIPPGGALLVGAHYDSVPGTPGADDNASAVAALLACAKAISEIGVKPGACFASFNREEDELAGSLDFVENFLPQSKLAIREAHVLEMVGYSRDDPGSQKKPGGMPISIPDVGNFLGLIGNSNSNPTVDRMLDLAKSGLPDFPVVGLKVFFGMEKFFPHLNRSDHAPFWKTGIPAIMWTDTSEFRNPNYHLPTDTPDTLDYDFLKNVARLLLLACVRG